jgi:fructose-1,6-bisphosphatase I
MQIANACKVISHKISRASLDGLTGYTSTNITNYHGEQVKTLDVVSNDIFVQNLQEDSNVCALISEEVDEVIKCNPKGKYIVTFDPLDGSSNIDANVNIGSIFGIFKRTSDEELNEKDYLRKGSEMLVGVYCLYGASTMLVEY